ncbi:MarR family transcriptional regulator, partial [Nitrosomonadales bacterium]|nr:MarR family transcriptional regulator [Nitrosomonadales bacterium]
MLVLWENGASSVKEIANTLKLDSPTITPIVQKLEKMNLVNRKRSSQDERVVTVTLTKTGIDIEGQVA